MEVGAEEWRPVATWSVKLDCTKAVEAELEAMELTTIMVLRFADTPVELWPTVALDRI